MITLRTLTAIAVIASSSPLTARAQEGPAAVTEGEQARPADKCSDRNDVLARIAGQGNANQAANQATSQGPTQGQSLSDWKKIDRARYLRGELGTIVEGGYDESTLMFLKHHEKSHLVWDNRSQGFRRMGIIMGVQVTVRKKNASASLSLPGLGDVLKAGTNNYELSARFVYKGAQSTDLDKLQSTFKWDPNVDGLGRLDEALAKAWPEIHDCDTVVWEDDLGAAPCVTREDREYASAVVYTLQRIAGGSTLHDTLVDLKERKRRPYGLVVKEIYQSFGVDESRHEEPLPESMKLRAGEELAPWGLLPTQCRRSS